MDQKSLFKMKTPELRDFAAKMTPPLDIPIRWGKPKILKAIQAAMNQKNEAAGPGFYDEFLKSGPGAINPDSAVQEADSIQPDTPVQDGPGRGGVRPGAGRPEGSTEAAVRLKRALNVKAADVNIRGLFQRLSMLNPKKVPAADDVIDNAALYTTRAGEYFDLMDRVKNTPYFIFGALAFWLFQLLNHIRKNNGKDNPDLRTPGNGEEQSRPDAVPPI
jgi:hypothetical protein